MTATLQELNVTPLMLSHFNLQSVEAAKAETGAPHRVTGRRCPSYLKEIM